MRAPVTTVNETFARWVAGCVSYPGNTSASGYPPLCKRCVRRRTVVSFAYLSNGFPTRAGSDFSTAARSGTESKPVIVSESTIVGSPS